MPRVQRSLESNLYEQWLSRSKRHAKTLYRSGRNSKAEKDDSKITQDEVESLLTEWKASVGNRKLTLGHIEGGFYVLGLGCVVAVLAFIGEQLGMMGTNVGSCININRD